MRINWLMRSEMRLWYYRAKGGEDTKSLGSRNGRSILTGVLGGAFSGLTGVGGGSIMVPLLTGPLKLSQHRAHGTSLAIIIFIALSGAIGYWRAGNIDWGLALSLAPGAILGVFIGARTMAKVPAFQLRLLFGGFLFFVAFRQLVWTISAGTPHEGTEGVLIALTFGFVGGVLAGVLGVGGGVVFVPAMLIFGLLGEGVDDPQKVAQGVSLVVIIATGVFGTWTNLRSGLVDTAVVRTVVPVAVVAALVTSLFANELDDDVLRYTFGFVALALGAQIVINTLGTLRRRTEVLEA